jgi:hypothetical protein
MESATTLAPSRLLDLPAEIRLIIYEYVGCSDVAPLLGTTGHHSGIFYENHVRHPTLLRICHEVTSEAASKVLQQQRLCPALSLTVELGERMMLLWSILRLVEEKSRNRGFYDALLSNFPPNTAITHIAPFYHRRKKEAARRIELRILLTKEHTKKNEDRMEFLLSGLGQLDDRPHFVFVVNKEMEAEWRSGLEKMEAIKEFGWTMQVLPRSPVIGLD